MCPSQHGPVSSIYVSNSRDSISPCQSLILLLPFSSKTRRDCAAATQHEVMARKRRADSSSAQPTPMSAPRRRSTLRDLQNSTADGDIITPKIIDARLSLEKAEMYGIDDPRPASKRIMALVGRIFIETIPQWLAVGGMMGLIFGGCCSNVSNCPQREGNLSYERRLILLLGICTGSYCQVSPWLVRHTRRTN